MMEIYKIQEADLNPEVVRRWKGEEDEGVALEGEEAAVGDPEMNQKEALRLLGLAMRRNIEAQVPMRRPEPLQNHTWPAAKASASPKSQPSSNAGVKSPTTSRPSSRKSSLPRKLTTIPDDEEWVAPTWLAPLISTSSNSRDSLLNDEKYLKKSYSAPNLFDSPRPKVERGVSSESVPTLRSPETESIRSAKLSGSWFGKMRERIGGNSRGVRALEKEKERRVR